MRILIKFKRQNKNKGQEERKKQDELADANWYVEFYYGTKRKHQTFLNSQQVSCRTCSSSYFPACLRSSWRQQRNTNFHFSAAHPSCCYGRPEAVSRSFCSFYLPSRPRLETQIRFISSFKEQLHQRNFAAVPSRVGMATEELK